MTTPQTAEPSTVGIGPGDVKWVSPYTDNGTWSTVYIGGYPVLRALDGTYIVHYGVDMARRAVTDDEVRWIRDSQPGSDHPPVWPEQRDLVASPADDLLDPSWLPIDLGPAWRGEKVRPDAVVFQRDDGLALLLPGINYLFGDSGDGKSMVALLAVIAEIKAGVATVWVSYEDSNEDLLVERFRLLGCNEIELDLVHFITPQSGLTHGAQHIAGLATATGARLVVLDSVGEAMAVGGVNEDKDNEVGPWFRQTLRLIHDQGPEVAILPIDHSTKSKDNPLFPSGSKRKRAAPTGRSYLLNVRSSFAVGEIGYVQLVVAKDRAGTFKRGAVAAEIMLDATVQPYRFTVKAGRDGDNHTAPAGRRHALERVREVLGESAVAVTAEGITRIANSADRIQTGETPLSIKTVKNTLATLAKDPEVTQVTCNEPSRTSSGPAPSLWLMNRPEPEGR